MHFNNFLHVWILETGMNVLCK